MASTYRGSGPNPPRDLVRLSQEGAAMAAREADRQVRVALGENFGAPTRTLGYALMGVSFLMFLSLTVIHAKAWLTAGLYLGSALMIGGSLLSFRAPVASVGALANEQRWLASQPFPVAGYFELLGQKPAAFAAVRVRVRFVAEPPPLELVQGLLARLKSAGAAESTPEGALLLRSAPLDCEARTRRRTYNNHPLVAYVHDLLGDVLLRLHGTYPIAGVELERED